MKQIEKYLSNLCNSQICKNNVRDEARRLIAEKYGVLVLLFSLTRVSYRFSAEVQRRQVFRGMGSGFGDDARERERPEIAATGRNLASYS